MKEHRINANTYKQTNKTGPDKPFSCIATQEKYKTSLMNSTIQEKNIQRHPVASAHPFVCTPQKVH